MFEERSGRKSVPQRVNDYITSLYPKAICNVCIAKGTDLSDKRGHPAQVTAALATTTDFVRTMGKCSICKNEKQLIRAARRRSKPKF